MSNERGVPPLRIGQGFDVHRFSDDPERLLVLGGTVIEGAAGLEGHSDADVVCHALADAMLGAASLGDLGEHFPDTDPEWAGVRSIELVERVLAMLEEKDMFAVNADCTIVCETPRLAGYTSSIARGLSKLVGAPVSVKVKSAETLGAIGRAEGIACMVVVLVGSAGAGGAGALVRAVGTS